MELDLPGGAPLLDRVEGERAQHGAERQAALLVEGDEPVVGGGGERLLGVAQRVERARRRAVALPVRLVAAARRLDLGQRHEGGDRLAERRRAGEAVADLAEPRHHVLLPVAGGHVGGGEVRTPPRQRLAIGILRRGQGGRDAGLDEVPVGLEVLGHLADRVVEAEPAPVAQLGEAHRRRVVEEGFDEGGVALVEGDRALHLVEHLEVRRQRRLDGELGEQPAGEGVQRADRGLVQVGHGRHARRRVGARRGERDAQAVAQLCRSLLREGDRGDAGDRDAADDEVDDAGDERGGLAAPGAGGDEQCLVERFDDELAGGLVRGRRAGEQVELFSHRRPRRTSGRAPGRPACGGTPRSARPCRGGPDRSTRSGRTAGGAATVAARRRTGRRRCRRRS